VSSEPSIQLTGVGKRYIRYHDTPLLVSAALRAGRRRDTLWAVRDLDLDVAAGECLGVLGRNGSGKSTLLQMLGGVTAPSEGTVTVRGRIAPLISVGVGFHQELTGRENVYLNAEILGLDRAVVERRFDEIVTFAEIEEFIDTPVKFYSSGMFVRLGFSIAVQAEPDVLLIDEVLAVGDLAFQIRCYERMEEIRKGGATVVVVSHNLAAISRQCSRGIVMEAGRKIFDGPTDEAIGAFHDVLAVTTTVDGTEVLSDARSHLKPTVSLSPLHLQHPDGRTDAHVNTGDKVNFVAHVTSSRRIERPVLGFAINSDSGVPVYVNNTYMDTLTPISPGDSFECRVEVTLSLAGGSYQALIWLNEFIEGQDPPTLGQARPLLFFVTGRGMVKGVADLDAQLSIEAARADPAAAPRKQPDLDC
jgi:ABC-type polysaccharide/polyol phosphate transport system ATPase subunit